MSSLTMESARVRRARRELKQQLRDGELDLATVLSEPPVWAREMRVLDVLRACHGVGPDWLRVFNIRAARATPAVNLLNPLGALTERQRTWLVDQVTPHLRRRIAA